MGSVVQHNISAMNANNAMAKNVSGLKKSTEKLSTGYSINRAADNAAGLAISEKMRSQIRGLTQATANSNDAISLIQTAEGGLQETEDIMQRMRELAVQSANGTYTDEDREQIQHEVDALKDEVDRISSATEYNEMKLLDGSLDGGAGDTGVYGPRYGIKDTAGTAFKDALITSDAKGTGIKTTIDATAGGESAIWSDDGKTLTFNLVKDKVYTQSEIDDLIANADTTKAGGKVAQISVQLENGVTKAASAAETTDTTVEGVRATKSNSLSTLQSAAANGYADTITFTSNSYGKDTRKITISVDAGAGKEYVERTKANNEDKGTKDGEFTLHLSTGVEYTEGDIEKLLAKEGLDYSIDLTDAKDPDGDKIAKFDKQGKVETQLDKGAGVGKDEIKSSGEGLTFQIGANGVEDQRLTVNISDMSTRALGIGNVSVAKQDDANTAINKIDDAIKSVSSQRAKLGAVQNRLEHTVNSLNTANENLSAAESQIRDTDMAAEMIKYTKSNILQQASQSMLAQANQQPQGVLQLLG